LVTGGAGFIGSHIAEVLLAAGHEVTVLDDLSSGRRSNLDELSANTGGPSRLRFIEGSIVDDAAVEAALEGVSAVFHQAAIPSVPRSFANPAATLRANVEGTARVLESCRRHGVTRFVFASSSSVYGDTPTLPKHEGMPPCPLSPYALSKLAGEHLCEIYARQHGIRAVALRYFNVFGPRQDPNSEYAAVVPKFICRMLDGSQPMVYGDGQQSRDFTYVDNVVAANLLAAGVPFGDARDEDPGSNPNAMEIATLQPGALVVNVGAGTRHTIDQLIAELNSILGCELAAEHGDARPGDVRHSHASVDKASESLGYEPTVGFEEGLRRTVTWFSARHEPVEANIT